MSADLFGHVAAPPMRVRLDRTTDREQPCCENIAVIRPGKGPHAGELRCDGCGRHRGWLPREALDFLTELSRQFGAPAEPLILRDQQIGDHVMADGKQYDNSGILFRNEDKREGDSRDRDYKGEATINGVGYWMSGWIKDGKKGKFMTFSFKPKDAPKAASAQASSAAPYNDEVPF
jgi:hypothetical protein